MIAAPSVLRRRATRAALLLLTLCAAALFPAAARAQDLGTLQGTVSDAQGTPLPSAIVEIELEIGGNVRRGATTDAAGRYRIIGLPPGPYRVNVRRTGYRNASGRALVALNEVLTQNFVLQVRPIVIDTINVRADNPVVIRREDTEFSTEVREEAIQLLPMRTDPKEAVALTPGARAEQVWGGSTAQANNYQIDGLSANHPGVGGDLVQPSINWVESIEVRGLGAAAEYGNFQGGLVNINTKRGTNDFQGAFRGAVDGAQLTASNLQRYDVASEMNSRWDLEGELRGPIWRDKIFYYVAGQFIRRDEQVVNHLRNREGFYAPNLIDWTEQKYFAKLTVTPTRRDELVASAGYLNSEADRFGSLGYEGEGGYLRMTAPTRFYNLGFTHLFGAAGSFEAAVSSFARDERRESIAGEGVPSVMIYGPDQIRPTYNAAPFNYRLSPSAISATTSLGWEMQTGPMRHMVKLGGEHSTGIWRSERLRNADMTWRPAGILNLNTFDPQDPATWQRGSFNFVPTEWGGEVQLDADVRNSAVYLQDHIDLGSRVSISPGVRYGWWTGWITPAEDLGTRFQAMSDQAFDARLGLTIDITGTNELVFKAHAGRYHQSMFAQFYERVEGAQVFSNQETWYHRGVPDSPGRTYTPAEREAMAADGRFTLGQVIRLNQTGPVDPDYKQPYIDQLVVGLERQLGRWWKAELVYVGRRNENMVALVDRNAATNYTRFDKVRVHQFSAGGILAPPPPVVMYNGYPLVLGSIYIPNWAIVDHLRQIERGVLLPGIPNLPPNASNTLTWNPDYVITNVPAADRTFHQVQGVVKMGYPRFGGTFSAVWSRLRGNLDNVAGYDDPSGFGAGPFVNPNQTVNFYGNLPNSSVWDLKLWAYGDLGRGFRAGIFWNELLGDSYTPHLNLSDTDFTYRLLDGQGVPHHLVASVYGQPVFVEKRGTLTYGNRATIDLHVERATKLGGTDWLITLDGFNLLGRTTPIRHNTAVNEGLNYTPFLPSSTEPENFYRAVRERVRPRSIRIGAVVKF